MPEPTRILRRPSTSRAIRASRTVGRETPSWVASSPLSRQPTANRKLTLIDEKPQLIGNAAIKPARLNGLERQDLLLARTSSQFCFSAFNEPVGQTI
jgi:hypothetical protein